jgi:Tfp pilus assembly protein PilV
MIKFNLSKCEPKKGFSLIELLISFLIIMFLVLGIFQLVLQSMDIRKRSSAMAGSAELAAAKLEYLKTLSFEDPELKEGSYSEFIEGSGRHKRFQRAWEIEDISIEMKRVELECFSTICPQKKINLVLLLSRELGF